MSEQPAIRVAGVRVEYRPYLERVPTLRKALARRRHRTESPIVALDGVSFEVPRGQAVGIIGANGAGKSTLLRVIAGTLVPDAGEVTTNGATSTLLQLGAGFNRDLDGRMNVMLAGLAAGLSKREVRERFDRIVEYSGIGAAIDRPLKTYSSGMFSRLAFSVAMSLEPDILLVDEVLAVGDEAFRRKSEATMRDLLARSGTLLYITHSVAKLPQLCPRVIWLDRGRVRADGEAAEVVDAYVKHARTSR